jgi:ribosomal protein S25
MSAERRTTVKKKKRWGKIYEYTPTIRASILDDDLVKEIEGELKKAGTQTPQSLAKKFDIKVSLAKKILSQYADQDKLNKVHSKSKYQIYSK